MSETTNDKNITDICKSAISVAESGFKMSLEDCFKILDHIEILFRREQNVLDISPPVLVVADMHGQLFDMLNIFEKCKSSSKFLFLGDYVDRGPYSVELFIYLAAKKILEPNNFYLIRGNHEDSTVNSTYGLMEDCKNIYKSISLYNRLNEVFKSLPVAALIGNKIFCVHGGFGPKCQTIAEINEINRFKDIDSDEILTDLTWSDPDFIKQKFRDNTRGAGHLMSKEAVLEFIAVNDLKLFVRAHQTQDLGFKYYFEDKLLSLWSAPLYYGTQSLAKVLKVDANLEMELIPIDPHEKRSRHDEVMLEYFAY